jgi:hypothetical protein
VWTIQNISTYYEGLTSDIRSIRDQAGFPGTDLVADPPSAR